MKKLISMLVAVLLLTALSVPAFAIDFDPDPGAVRDQSGNPDTVPMYGYVGEAKDSLTDPDPDDPGVNPWKLNVSVPVKFLWAAFVPDVDPDINLTAPLESPKYHIINNSDKDVEVSITNFTETHALSNGSIEIYFTETDPVTPIFDVELTVGVMNEVLGIIDADGGDWEFEITGEYDSEGNGGTGWSKDTQYPEYLVEFTFMIDK